MQKGAALAVWVLASCYGPRLPPVLRCSDGGACPSGLSCVDGYCSGHPGAADAAGLDRVEWEPPQVVSVAPGNGVIADPTTMLTVTFSEAMDPASLNTSSFVLNRGSVPVLGAVGASGNRATFTPQNALMANTMYTAAITSMATDAAGNPLPSSTIWSFTTDRIWLPNRGLDTEAPPATAPHAALNAAGDAVVVWQQSDGSAESIWAARRPAGGSWTQAELLEISLSPASAPRVALDAAGNAVAVWLLASGPRNDVWFTRRPAGGAWSGPQLVENDDSGGDDVLGLAVDDAGNVVVVWRQATLNLNYYRVLASRAPAGGAFTGLQVLEGSAYRPTPSLALAHDGSGFVVWDKTTQLFAAPLSPTGIGSTAAVTPMVTDGVRLPAVAAADGGRALLAWTQGDSGGVTDRVWSARFTSATGWSAPDPIESFSGTTPEVATAALSTSGVGLAAWVGTSATAARYDPVTAWGRDLLIEPGGHGPAVAIDALGNGLEVSFVGTATGPVMSRRILGLNWSTAGITLSTAGTSGNGIVLVMTPAGDALAAWLQGGDVREAEFR